MAATSLPASLRASKESRVHPPAEDGDEHLLLRRTLQQFQQEVLLWQKERAALISKLGKAGGAPRAEKTEAAASAPTRVLPTCAAVAAFLQRSDALRVSRRTSMTSSCTSCSPSTIGRVRHGTKSGTYFGRRWLPVLRLEEKALRVPDPRWPPRLPNAEHSARCFHRGICPQHDHLPHRHPPAL